LPPLVNAHIHLELSHIRMPVDREPLAGFTDWIGRLLELRERDRRDEQTVTKAAREALDEQHRAGVIAIGDIGNTDLGEQLAVDFPGFLFPFREVLGRSRKTRKAVLAALAAAAPGKLFTAHAPYSTHPDIIRAIKDRARRLGHPFSIHAAEPASEPEMLSAGSGELFDFLVRRGFIDNTYRPPAGIDNPGSVRYLHGLGVLDRQTICVHCIHVDDAEVRMIAEAGSSICVCPGSNRFLNVGRAPVKKFLANGILPALGTDSRASNPVISPWSEMRTLRGDHPEVSAGDVLAMATLGGARALGLERDHGTLAAGKSARFLAVQVPEHVDSAAAVLDYLTADSEGFLPAWITAA
jgi:cytosine/adenosine deaminase-related metal-dependent hydrolase